MPLLIKNCIISPTDVTLQSPLLFIQKYGDIFQSENDQLKSKEEQTITPSMNILYVNQREVAGFGPNDGSLQGLGTDMATTCHIVVLRCPQTKATALGHFDGSSTEQGVRDMVKFVSEISDHTSPSSRENVKTFDLHMVGGFDDSRGTSHLVTSELLTSFAGELPGNPVIRLKTYCCDTFNQKLVPKCDEMVKSPVIFGLVVMIDTGKYFPAVFENAAKSPEGVLRGTRCIAGPQSMMHVYNWKHQEATIFAFDYLVHFDDIPDLLKLSDEELRERFSTSPDVEPDNFSESLRASFQFMMDYPDPREDYFKGEKVLRFKKNGPNWDQVER